MSYTSVQEAIAALSNVNATQADILAFVRRLSVEASGSTTVLYSGDIAGTPAWTIVEEMNRSGEDVRHIGKTIAAGVLDSKEFKTKVAQAFGLTFDELAAELRAPDSTHPAKLWLNKGGSGPWATISEMFVEATTGKVKILTELPAANSVFLQNELPKLIAKLQSGSDISEISGATRAQLIELAKTGDLRNAILLRACKETLLSKPTITNFSSFLSFTDEIGLARLKVATPDEMRHMVDTFKALPLTTTGARLMARLGPWFAAIAAFSVATQANAANEAGRPDEARHLIEDFGAEMACSTIAQAAAGALAAAGLVLAGIAAVSPVGIATILIATLAGGYFGGEWGTELIHLFQDRSEERARDIAQRMLKLVLD